MTTTRTRAKTTTRPPALVETPPSNSPPRSLIPRLYPALVALAFVFGLSVGYLSWGRGVTTKSDEPETVDLALLLSQVNPEEGYALPASYGDLGPRLLKSGAIDYDAFVALYENGGDPLSEAELEILTRGSGAPILINADNAHFLLNFFWAVGLANKNPILTTGPMAQYGGGSIEGFASTGGWTLATIPVVELYSSVDLIPLTADQQQIVEDAAALIYRPCCDNSTLFPDCNHGMAMLGLLEWMASNGASLNELLTAAKHVNAFWFPQQNLETAVYLAATTGTDFSQADPRLVTGRTLSSGSGFAAVHQSLQVGGLIPQAGGGSGSCSN